VNALLHPHEVIRAHRELFGSSENTHDDTTGVEEDEESSLLKLPDTSILFERYMEAGRLINVYDLFQSFSVALEQQREQFVQAASQQDGKGKGIAPGEDETPEDEEERWPVEVHARFIRALHELDYMGFIKHTGRKADHVLKTVYDVPD
jgi:origin recognition complex subunit 3